MVLSYDEQIERLQVEPTPDVLRNRPGGKGMTLTYLEGYYVIDLLNEIFGPTGWLHTVENLTVDGNVVYALVTLQVFFNNEDLRPVVHQDVGSTTVKGSDLENAIKTAVTDGLKRAARCLGNAFGNSLYDKDNPLLASNQSGKSTKRTTSSRTTSGKSSSRGGTTSTSASGSGKAASFDPNPKGAPEPNGPDGTYVCEVCNKPIQSSDKYSAAQYAMFSHNQDGRILDWQCRKDEGS